MTSIRNNMNAVNAKIDQNRDIAAAGTASALAASQIRFADRPGSQSLGIGGGLYDGQGAIAAGYGFTSADGAWRGNASVSYAPGVQKVGVGAGVSVTW